MRKLVLRSQNNKIDSLLLIIIVLFIFLGVVFVLNASAPEAINNFSDRFYFAKQQLIWGILAIITILIVSKINYLFWQKIAGLAFFFSVLLLVIVLLPKVGMVAMGAKRWINIAHINIQPSELVKLTLILYLAKVSSKNEKIFSYLIPLSIVIALVMLQPDLGTSLVITIIAFSQIFISGLSLLKLAYLSIAGVITSFILILASNYRKERLLSFLSPLSDTLGRSYHIRQILFALGSGGLFGVGLGQSRQKYLFLPEASTDSIFAVIAEELGFVGALILIFLFVIFINRCLRIIKNTPDRFSEVMITGITAWLASQTLINLTSMVALTPLTGIPLPFISYGGSSLVSISIACGILLNVSKNIERG